MANEKKSRPVYSPEFKAGAVELVRSGGAYKDVSTDLDVSVQTLRNWVRQAEIEKGRKAGLKSDERLELGKLRRENKTLRMEREILKKASAFFASEINTTK